MVQFEFLTTLVEKLCELEITYFITGSMATMYYGEPRTTLDVDIVVEVGFGDVRRIAEAFPAPEYYCSQTMIEEAIRRRSQFNILHIASGMEVDVIVSDGSAFNQSRFRRKRQLWINKDLQGRFSSPEDVILKKNDVL